eukprot:07142_6
MQSNGDIWSNTLRGTSWLQAESHEQSLQQSGGRQQGWGRLVLSYRKSRQLHETQSVRTRAYHRSAICSSHRVEWFRTHAPVQLLAIPVHPVTRHSKPEREFIGNESSGTSKYCSCGTKRPSQPKCARFAAVSSSSSICCTISFMSSLSSSEELNTACVGVYSECSPPATGHSPLPPPCVS